MDDLIRRSEAQELLECYTEKNNLGHTPYQIVSNLPSAGPKWISVEERLPENYESVLLWFSYRSWANERRIDCEEAAVGWRADDLWYIERCSGVRVTHWMPLPDPPKEVQDA